MAGAPEGQGDKVSILLSLPTGAQTISRPPFDCPNPPASPSGPEVVPGLESLRLCAVLLTRPCSRAAAAAGWRDSPRRACLGHRDLPPPQLPSPCSCARLSEVPGARCSSNPCLELDPYSRYSLPFFFSLFFFLFCQNWVRFSARAAEAGAARGAQWSLFLSPALPHGLPGTE